MRKKLHKFLPKMVLISGVIAVVFLTLLVFMYSELKEENPINRSKALDTLEEIQALHPEDVQSPAFKSKIEEILNSKHIATVWLISPEGEVLFSKGSTSGSLESGLVREYATEEIKDIINSLPPSAFNDDQRTLILAASAIQRERSHNNIYNHLLREINSHDGSRVGLVGLAYELTSSPGGVSMGWKISILIALLSFLLYWFSLPVWIYLDAKQRGERYWQWALFASLGNLVSLITYLLVRHPIEHSLLSRNRKKSV